MGRSKAAATAARALRDEFGFAVLGRGPPSVGRPPGPARRSPDFAAHGIPPRLGDLGLLPDGVWRLDRPVRPFQQRRLPCPRRQPDQLRPQGRFRRSLGRRSGRATSRRLTAIHVSRCTSSHFPPSLPLPRLSSPQFPYLPPSPSRRVTSHHIRSLRATS